jgi:FkbM family methyltransferase
MKVFIDLGMYDGTILRAATKMYKDFDKFIGFEPIPELCSRANKLLKNKKKVVIKNQAVGTADSKEKLYINWTKRDQIGKGSSLMSEKTTGNLKEDKFMMVDVINFSDYLKNNLSKDDFIVLKIDIEGKEYDLLNHMIDTEAISYIDKIFCEWHYHKMKGGDTEYKVIHDKIIKDLNDLGFDVTGDRKKDEFSKVINKKYKTRHR